MSEVPRVSVVVPTYNRLELLRETVASVQAQTYVDWELIVVDDGSTDGTTAWLRGLGDPRVSVLQLPHTGNLGHVRNRGNARARGGLIAFLDSDDLFESTKLELQLAALDRHPECGWSYTSMSVIDAAGAAVDEPALDRFRQSSGWVLQQVLRFDAMVDTPSVMVRRELLARVGSFDESLSECQDYDLFFRLAAASPAVGMTERLTRKRAHAGTLSADRTRVNEAWIEVYERFGSASDDPDVRRTCARQAWKHRLAAASSRIRGRRDLGGAMRHVLPALARRPWSRRAWRVLLADVLVRGVLRLRR